MELEKTMKDLGLLNMKCDCEKKLSSTKISEARYVAISLSDWLQRRRKVLKQQCVEERQSQDVEERRKRKQMSTLGSRVATKSEQQRKKENRDIEKRQRVFMYLFRIFHFSKLILQLLDRNEISQFYPKVEELTLRN